MSERTARRAAQLNALGVVDTRGTRFANRLAGAEGPTLADLAAVPRWLMLAEDQQARVAMAAGLLRHKSAIQNELSGQKLAALADVVGEDLLDAVSALPTVVDSAPNMLPRPEDLVAKGWLTLHRGLPAPFASRFPDAANDADARVIAEAAFDLVQSSL
jgi:hypothetical protein